MKFNLKENKKLILFIILGIALLYVVVFFFIKSVNKEKKDNKDNNYTLTFVDKSADRVNHKMSFKYVDKELENVKLILVFEDKELAKEISELYLEENQYANVKVVNNNVELYLNSADMKEYINLDKDELIEKMSVSGYVLVK